MKKTSKKLLSLVLALVLAFTTGLSCLVVASGAQVTKPGPNIEYSFDEATGTFTLTGTGEMYTFRDTKIAKNGITPWSNIKEEIKKVVVGEGITTIGEYAFYNCVNLTEVQLPSTLTTICGSGVTGGAASGSSAASYGAFRGCESLTKINFPESLTTIEAVAFRDCSALEVINLPDNITSLGIGSFVHCTGLKKVTFGNSITEIPVECFYECSNLLDIEFSSSVTKIGMWAFYGIRANTIDLPDSVKTISGRGFADCYFLRETTIRNKDCSIADYAFDNSGITGSDGTRTLTIKGHTGSTAETYAKDKGYNFVSLDDCWHQFQEERIVTPATCTEDGVKETYCTVCGQVLSTGVDACLGHDFDEEKTRVQDDTKVDGHIRTYEYCKKCKEEVVTLEHVKGEKDPDSQTSINLNNYVWVEGYYTYENTATCTKTGTEKYTCTVDGCGRYIDVTVGSQTIKRFYPTTEEHVAQKGNHDVANWVTTKEPTCTEAGSKTGKCSKCSENVTEKIEALGHTIDEENPTKVTDLTTQNGHIIRDYECTVCHKTTSIYEHAKNPNKTEDNDETEYIWIEGEYTPSVVSPAGCVVSGLARYKCDLPECDVTETVVLKSAGGHQWEENGVIEPTCTTAGQTNYKCSVCGMTKQDNRVEALGHDLVLNSKKDPTCTVEGLETYFCSRCSFSKNEVLEKLGHKPDKDTLVVKTAATCEKAGKQSYTCSRCSEQIVDEEIAALGHDFLEIETPINDKPGHVMSTPTCQREGCNTTEPATVVHKEWLEAYTNHTTITAGTCTTGEIYTEQCLICNKVSANTEGTPLGHEYRFVRVYTESSIGSSDGSGNLGDLIGNLGGNKLAESGGSSLGDLIGGIGDGNIGGGNSNIGDVIGGVTDKYKVEPYSVVYICKHCANPTSQTGKALMEMWDRYYYNTAPDGRLTDNNSSYMDVTGDGFINAKDYAQIRNLNKQYQQYVKDHPATE